MTEQERLMEILRWHPGRFAKASGDHLLEIQNSKRPWKNKKLDETFNGYYFKMVSLTSNPNEWAAVLRYWLTKVDITVYPSLKCFDHFDKYGMPNVTKTIVNGIVSHMDTNKIDNLLR